MYYHQFLQHEDLHSKIPKIPFHRYSTIHHPTSVSSIFFWHEQKTKHSWKNVADISYNQKGSDLIFVKNKAKAQQLFKRPQNGAKSTRFGSHLKNHKGKLTEGLQRCIKFEDSSPLDKLDSISDEWVILPRVGRHLKKLWGKSSLPCSSTSLQPPNSFRVPYSLRF